MKERMRARDESRDAGKDAGSDQEGIRERMREGIPAGIQGLPHPSPPPCPPRITGITPIPEPGPGYRELPPSRALQRSQIPRERRGEGAPLLGLLPHQPCLSTLSRAFGIARSQGRALGRSTAKARAAGAAPFLSAAGIPKPGASEGDALGWMERGWRRGWGTDGGDPAPGWSFGDAKSGMEPFTLPAPPALSPRAGFADLVPDFGVLPPLPCLSFPITPVLPQGRSWGGSVG